jgi:signal transduction histidine kinase/CheY-like chemotaxis protein
VNTVSPEVVFSYMNDNFAKNYRTTKEALSDPDVFWDSVYEDSEFREEMTARVLSDCDSGDPERMHWEDIPITRRGQETAYITARNIPVPDENMMISIVWDVTDRKRVEEAIRESEATLKGILDNVGIGIALIGKEMQVLSLNRTMQEWFPSIDVSDTPICYNVYNDPPRDTPCSYCPTILTLADGKVHEAVTETPTGEGMRHYRIVSSPLLDAQGNIIAAIEMVDDITDRMQVETDRRKLETQLHQSQKMDAIGQLAAGVAHDFNNLLGGIMGYADLLMMDLLPGSSEANYTEEILKASSRAADLTRQLLTFSRKGRMQTADVDVHSVIDEVISLLSRSIDKSIEIAQQLEASPSVVSGDATELQGAVLNLAINARDAMPDGGQLTFTTRTLLIDEHYCAQHADDISPGLYVEIAVSDTGVGMDADVKQHLFEPFFTTKEQGKGTGLGLAGVYGCVKDHLGAIRVYSKLGLGSTVKMLLPVCAEATAVTAAVTQAPVYGHGHILVIDDEKVVRRFTSTALTHLGYRVSCCCNGEEGVAFFRDHHTEVDLVILDMIMPKLNGEEAFRLLKEIDPDVRVLIASGFAPNYTSKTVIDAGALGFLPKPFLVETLSYEIARCLSART